MNILNKNNYHFIGVGGIGVSAIARMLFLQGKKVSGSDIASSEITDDMEKLGINVFIGQKAENINSDVEVAIYTVAIKDNNPELLEARKKGITCVSYPEALGELSKDMFTIAVSGTHGKTTTTAMIGHILKEVEMDPTVIVGSKILGQNSNFLAGKSKYLVAEACEYKRSFLNLHPNILVITNIEADHLDYYKDIEDIKSAFSEIAEKVPDGGFIITDKKNENIKDSTAKSKAKVLDYKEIKTDFNLRVFGEHNILNARAALKVTEVLGISKEKAIEALKSFKGTWRRLEFKGEKGSNLFYTDYAHHPTEVRMALNALKEEHSDKEIICIFEPHQQSRTKLLFDDFVDSLKIADKVFIAPIFKARETLDKTISNEILARAVNKFTPTKAIENILDLSETDFGKNACVVFMGAGDIYKWVDKIIK